MAEQFSTFTIIREDRGLDPTTLVIDGLRIGRAPDSHLVLNHPYVSRLHAGIKEIDGRFYLIHLSSSNPTTLNGRIVALDQAEALASGDEAHVGPFFLRIERKDDALEITVSLQFGLRVGDAEARSEAAAAPAVKAVQKPAPKQLADALDLFWGKRSREKAGRISSLHPHRPPRPGKIRFNWTPTRDLVRPWPFSVFIWAAIVLGAISAAAAFWYASAYAPNPISNAHSQTSLMLMPAVAREPNSGSCTTCHSFAASMVSRCTSCHTTDAFVGTVTKSHADAGVGCLDCHSEHHGADFKPMQAALNSCTGCHSDNNKKTYNGKMVSTPHRGTLGYPVVGGQWTWKGLDPEELAARPRIAALRLPTDTEQVWRRKQFHALHLYRVKANGGLTGVANPEGGSAPVLSCSSCHKSITPPDREYPRQTCRECHAGPIDLGGRAWIAAGVPNCISCHVQHVRDKRHWNPDLLAQPSESELGGKISWLAPGTQSSEDQ